MDYLNLHQLKSLPHRDILSSKVYTLMYYLLHAGSMEDEIMNDILQSNPDIQSINEKYQSALTDDQIRIQAEQREKFVRDQVAIREYALEQGRQEGMDFLILTMNSQGMSIQDISKYTKIPVAEISEILNESP